MKWLKHELQRNAASGQVVYELNHKSPIKNQQSKESSLIISLIVSEVYQLGD